MGVLIFYNRNKKKLVPRALLSYISTWEFLRTREKCEKHEPQASASRTSPPLDWGGGGIPTVRFHPIGPNCLLIIAVQERVGPEKRLEFNFSVLLSEGSTSSDSQVNSALHGL